MNPRDRIRHPRLYGLTTQPRTRIEALLDQAEALAHDHKTGFLELLKRDGYQISAKPLRTQYLSDG